MNTKHIEKKIEYLCGVVDCEISNAPSYECQSVLEEPIFKDFIRNCCDCNGKFTDEIFELGLSVLYAGWLQHD